jgi:hypothetical protein
MTDNPSTELAAMTHEIEPGQDFMLVPTTKAVQRLEMHQRAMEHAHAIAKVYSWSDAVPDAYCRFTKDKDGNELGDRATYNATIAILHGVSLGLSPDAALENIFMIKGKPATYARLMVALVNRWIDERVAAGRTTADPDHGDRIWEIEASPTKCTWGARRDGITKYSDWTYARAQTAGYTTNKLYQSIPQEMLTAKAQAEVCRIVFPDVILGLSHSIEELRMEDGISVQRMPSRRGPRGVEALRELAEKQTQTGPGDADPAAATAVSEVPADVASTEQLEAIKKLARQRKLAGQAMLDDIAAFLQRQQPLGELRDLSHEEAQAYLDGLPETAEQP